MLYGCRSSPSRRKVVGSVLLKCGEVKFSRSPRPHDDVTSIEFNGSTHCSLRTWRGCLPVFSHIYIYIYINARNVSTSSVSERNSAVDRVLRILPRSSDLASCIKGRLHLSVNSGCSFPCMYVLSRIEFHWNALID